MFIILKEKVMMRPIFQSALQYTIGIPHLMHYVPQSQCKARIQNFEISHKAYFQRAQGHSCFQLTAGILIF